ncbi:pyridoxamine 5'-phosphate oxidase family protein [uncultured Jatrophihabitans sp.]|uniref:pyridoxamine 5'-phosphate oxidase family protein n=1 Tax=uncultured Jatrophihabitans sp. TaxID=1610747 RepID=UPI0035CA8C92
MTTWADVRAGAPELAETVRRTFAIRKHATMATIRRDGAPRISGTEIEFADDGNVFFGMSPDAMRAHDLRRDPRVAIHCPTEDAPGDDPASWLGEGKIIARAVEDEPGRFRLDVQIVVLTRIAPGARALEISTWNARTGETTIALRE